MKSQSREKSHSEIVYFIALGAREDENRLSTLRCACKQWTSLLNLSLYAIWSLLRYSDLFLRQENIMRVIWRTWKKWGIWLRKRKTFSLFARVFFTHELHTCAHECVRARLYLILCTPMSSLTPCRSQFYDRRCFVKLSTGILKTLVQS